MKVERAVLSTPERRDGDIAPYLVCSPSYGLLKYGVATGLIAGNVYLFAASQGLAAWFHNCDRDGLAGVLKLRPDQRVLFAQTVGYPA